MIGPTGLLWPILIAYGIAFSLPPIRTEARFPTRRDILALGLMAALSGGLGYVARNSGYFIVIAYFLFGLTLPPLIAGVAGRWPYFYGCLSNTAYFLWMLWLLCREGKAPVLLEAYDLLLLFWGGLLLMALISCLPLSFKWRPHRMEKPPARNQTSERSDE